MINQTLETELYELACPGSLVGKEIIDVDARRIGICHSIKIRFFYNKKNELTTKLFLVIKGLDVEFDVPMETIEAVGNIIKLKIPARQSDEVQISDVIRLQEDVISEIRARVARI
ncbi:MAG: hypothetical protein ACTSWN_04195 [Promethearchaeota archaeon]